MSMKLFLIGAIALGSCAASFATPTNDAMRAAQAVSINSKYSSTVSLTRDAAGNVVSFHVNGVSPSDAGILLTKDSQPLSSEFTVVSGVTREGGTSAYMLPSAIATAHVVEEISRDLVNAGAINIQISRLTTGKQL